MWYIYTIEYYSAIKCNTFESVLVRWMNQEPVIQSEVNQKEKKHISYSNAYIWYLEKWQGRNRDSDRENRLMDMGGVRGGAGREDQFSSVHFSCTAVSDSLQPRGLQQIRPPCPSPTPGVYSNSCPLSQ